MNIGRGSFWAGVCLGIIGSCGSAVAADPTYWADVRPLMRKHCTICHSEKTVNEKDVSAGLALDSLTAIRKGGGKPIVVAGKGSMSELVTILRHPKPSRRMPLDADPLPDSAVELLRKWIDAGLPEGTRPKEVDGPGSGTAVTAERTARKGTIVLPTKLPLPAKVQKPGQTGPLEFRAVMTAPGSITATAFRNDGSQLAVGSYGRVVVWDLKAGKPAKVLTNVLGAVSDVRFSPDGKLLAVSGGLPSARGEVRLFTTADWKPAGTLGGHHDVVAMSAFHPKLPKLATASYDKTVRIWNLDTKQTEVNFTGHSDFVHAVAFAPTGEWVVTASKDRTSRMFESATGKSFLTLSGSDQEVLAVAVSSDGTRVAASGMDTAVSWYDAKTGERLKRVGGHGVSVNEIAFVPKGDLGVSAGSDQAIRFWSVKAMDALRTVPVGSIVYSCALSADGKIAVSGSFDGIVRMWETPTGRPLAALSAATEEEWIVVSPEGMADGSARMLAEGRWTVAGKDLRADWVWKAVRGPGVLARIVTGAKPADPTFADPQPAP